jgi:hypothetical protein
MLYAGKVCLRSPDSLSMKHNTWKLLEDSVFETLESRQMMSASPMGITLQNGTLSMNGDATKPTQMVVDYTSNGSSDLYARIGSVDRYFPASQVKNINITTGNGNDYVYINPRLKVDAIISVGNGNDSIHAGGGNAQITGGDGSDIIYGAQTSNKIQLGKGNNRVYGGPGNDNITVGSGDNYVWGGQGNDSISAGNGNNSILGAAGDDKITAGNGNNIINGGIGDDNLHAGTGHDSLFGYSGDDNLAGGGATSVVRGGVGINTIDGVVATVTTGGTAAGSSNSGGSSGTTSSGSGSTSGTMGTGTTGTGTGTTTVSSGTGTGTSSTGTGASSTGAGTSSTGAGAGSTGTGTGTTTTPTPTGTGTGTGTTGTGAGATGAGGTVAQPAPNPNAKAPTPVLKLVDGTRQVGLGVNVDALSSTLISGTPITANYQWDFGDPGTQFNTLSGFNASHVYDKPGTYNIKLTITNQDGGAASVTQQVTIAASARKQTFVDAVNGSDNNDGSQNAPYQTLEKALDNVGNNTDVLLHAGEKFNVTSSMHVGSTNVLVGRYGTGADPILNRFKGNGASTIALNNNSNGITIQNVTFDSPYGVGINDQAPKLGIGGVAIAGKNIVIRNCTFLNLDDAMNENGMPTGVLIQSNNAPLATGVRGYFVWGMGSQSTIVGNNAANSTREHIVRMVDLNEVNLENNNFDNMNRQNVDPSDFSKGAIEMHRGSYAFIADNSIENSDIRLGPLGLWGESTSSSTDYSVIEDNLLTNSVIFLNSGTHHALISNNVVTNDVSEAFNIAGVDGEGRTSEDITMIHNTAINNGTSGKFLKIGGYVNGITLDNNLWIAPHTQQNAIYSTTDTSIFKEVSGNIWPAQVTNATSDGYEGQIQWDDKSVVHGDQFKTVVLSDTYQVSLGQLIAGSSLARAA